MNSRSEVVSGKIEFMKGDSLGWGSWNRGKGGEFERSRGAWGRGGCAERGEGDGGK